MIRFRDADEADLPVVVGLLADDRFGQLRERDETPLPEAYRQGFRAMLTQGGRIILAVESGAVVGCLQLSVLHGVSQIGQARAQVEGVRVSSLRRGQGIGLAMMQFAIQEAVRAGCGLMQLTTRTDRPEARDFYAKLGFVHSHAGLKLALQPDEAGR